ARREAAGVGAKNVTVAERRVVEARQHKQQLAGRATRESNYAIVVVSIDDIEDAGPRCRVGGHQSNQILVEAGQEPSVTGSFAEQIFLVQEEVVVAEILGGADLFAHQEHRGASRQRRQASGTAAASLRVLPRRSDQRRSIHGGYDGPFGIGLVAGFVVV